jgi:hypothetical protein
LIVKLDGGPHVTIGERVLTADEVPAALSHEAARRRWWFIEGTLVLYAHRTTAAGRSCQVGPAK